MRHPRGLGLGGFSFWQPIYQPDQAPLRAPSVLAGTSKVRCAEKTSNPKTKSNGRERQKSYDELPLQGMCALSPDSPMLRRARRSAQPYKRRTQDEYLPRNSPRTAVQNLAISSAASSGFNEVTSNSRVLSRSAPINCSFDA